MSFIIGLLMLAMVLVCIALILLVLIQLPKKEAGIGVAFGGGATDALFGAGSGNVLTKATKWFAIAFFGLALLTGFLQTHYGAKGRAAAIGANIQEEASKLPGEPVTQPSGTSPAPAPATTPGAAPTTAPAQTPAK
ncbi:MAG: hypothetical protein RLY20_1049 [Verrucomicrobiota bacterium]|jgi:preprotein translocase subunit SecG